MLNGIMTNIQEILAYNIHGNSLFEWAVALVVSAIIFFLLQLLKSRGLKRLGFLAARTRLAWPPMLLETLEGTKTIAILLISLWAGSQSLMFAPSTEHAIQLIAMLALLIQVGLWASHFLNSWIKDFREQQIKKNPSAATTVGALRIIFHFIIWAIITMLVLDNLGVNITALVAGLGIGGVAVALAVQNILGDLFSSLSIVIDKTFVVGDFISLGEHVGTVEHIGLKNTRIRSLSGEQIIFSNSDLLGSRIRNFGRMYERRVVGKLGVVYQTTAAQLRRIPEIIRSAIEAHEKTRFDRAHFFNFGDSSLNIEYVYFVLSSEYNLYMDINQAINLQIMQEFSAAGIEFAYPTQTVYNMNPVALVQQPDQGKEA